MVSSILLALVVVVVVVVVPPTMAWAPLSVVPITHLQHYTSPRRSVASFAKKSSYHPVALFSSNTDDKEDVVAEQQQRQQEASQQQQQRTTFDQAGASLIEEEDKKRMDQMGDFDTNDAYQKDRIEKMRAAIRDRTAGLGLEKSKVTADYIAEKTKKAMSAGPPGVAAKENPDSFGGLDLSKISQFKDEKKGNSQWSEDMPSMFYEPEEELTKDEMEEVDPVMLQNPIQQAMNEFSNTKWPDWASALREVGLMLLIIALSGVLIIGWDKVLRFIYTSVGFIPTKEELMNYANKFDGLDLPAGWTDNMSDVDVQSFQETVNSATSTPDL